MRRLSFLVLFFSTALAAQPAEKKLSPQDYIDKYKDDAVREMLIAGVPASITLAQGMLESGNGNSALAVYANNHFGIKCHNDWTGDTFIQDDDASDECFRKYPSVLDSYLDHSNFLKTRNRYAFLFQLKQTDYEGWAKGLKEAGYATDPRYATRLIDIIEQYKLYDYDKITQVPSRPLDTTNVPGTIVGNNGSRQIFENNEVKYVVAKKGDSMLKLATELGMSLPEIYRYNDTRRGYIPQTGEMIYIQPKHRSSEKFSSHTVKPGETLFSISQQYGVKMRILRKRNQLTKGQEPKAGDVLTLKKK